MSHRFEKASITVSYILMILLLLALGFTTYCLDDVVNALIDTVDHVGDRANITEVGRRFVLIDAYTMVAIAVVTVVLLFLLLRVVQKEKVFSQSTPRLLNGISWCCFFEHKGCTLSSYIFIPKTSFPQRFGPFLPLIS